MIAPATLSEIALRYAELGFRVFPIAPGTKAPLTEHGHLEATVAPDVISRWWQGRPNANIGIATTNLLVVDVDAEATWLHEDVQKALDLAIAPISLTANGGTQYLFRQPPGKDWRCTIGKLAPHVDTRANGGYIVVPPSVLEGNKPYRWAPGQELEVAPGALPLPPDWLVVELDRLASGTPTLASVAAAGPESNKIPSGQRNATLAKLGGTMRRVGMSQPEIAAALLRVNADRCVPPLAPREVERIAASIARYEPDQIAVALAENHWEQLFAVQADAETAPLQGDPGPLPEHLLRVPGFVDSVIDYTMSTAPYPEPVLAFCAALALQGVLAGRKVRDEQDNRTNLYLLGLANSGAGKDYPRKVNQRILYEAGLTDAVGDTFASGEGIEDRMFLNPCVLFQTDEMDGLMTRINQARDSRHEAIINVLLKMFTSANAVYPLRVKAGKESGVIDQPCLCIFGTAIPRHYYEALSLKMLTNGFFARMLVLEARGRGKGQDAAVRNLPDAILETARWWAKYQPGGSGNLQAWHPVPTTVPRTPAAASLLAEFRQRADDQYEQAEAADDAVAMAVWARANEKARRLALVYACSQNHEDPEIQELGALWATQFVDYQTRRMLFMAGGSVSEGEFDGRCKKLVTTLRRWRDQHGDTWMPFWKISRKHPWSEREHDEVRTTLLNQRLIEYEERKTGGTPQRLYRMQCSS